MIQAKSPATNPTPFVERFARLHVAVAKELHRLFHEMRALPKPQGDRLGLVSRRAMVYVTGLAGRGVPWEAAWKAARRRWPVNAVRIESLLRSAFEREVAERGASDREWSEWRASRVGVRQGVQGETSAAQVPAATTKENQGLRNMNPPVPTRNAFTLAVPRANSTPIGTDPPSKVPPR